MMSFPLFHKKSEIFGPLIHPLRITSRFSTLRKFFSCLVFRKQSTLQRLAYITKLGEDIQADEWRIRPIRSRVLSHSRTMELIIIVSYICFSHSSEYSQSLGLRVHHRSRCPAVRIRSSFVGMHIVESREMKAWNTAVLGLVTGGYWADLCFFLTVYQYPWVVMGLWRDGYNPNGKWYEIFYLLFSKYHRR